MPATPPIEHVVILVKENHTFDNYFGTFPGADGIVLPHASNPPTTDFDHRHEAWLRRATGAARLQYGESDLPQYFAYARSFTLCDRYFSDVAGPSTPNHLMLITADSPVIDNPSGTPSYDLPSLPESLAGAGFSWENYGGYAFGFLPKLASHPMAPSERFVQDAASGKLPSVAWVYAPHALSEHPPDPPDRGKLPVVGNVTLGMEWTTQQLDALVRGGLWPSTAVFLTWDDWGGWFDHVDPPPVEAWVDGTQFRYGSRVPCLVLSPFARAGYISHALHSHVSLLRFCEVNFGLPPLNARDRAADAMQDCFDFSQAPLPPPGAPAGRSLIRKEGSGPPGHASGRKGARAGPPPGRVRR